MRRLLIGLVALVLLLGTGAPSAADKATRQWDTVTDLLVGTSAVLDTVGLFDTKHFDKIGVHITVDVTSGGGAGGGEIWFEGSVDTLGWTKLWIVQLSDSGFINQSFTLTSTTDLTFSGILVCPYDITDANAVIDGILDPTKYLFPYSKIRCIVKDTNWNAAAGVDGWYVYER